MEIKDIDVKRLMSTDLVTVSPDTPVEVAGDSLLDHGIGSLVVLDEGELVGILTSTDFVGMVTGGAETDGTPVEEYMTESVVTVGSEDSIRDAAAKMIADDIQHLPVVGEDGVVGMLSTTDLTAHLSYIDA